MPGSRRGGSRHPHRSRARPVRTGRAGIAHELGRRGLEQSGHPARRQVPERSRAASSRPTLRPSAGSGGGLGSDRISVDHRLLVRVGWPGSRRGRRPADFGRDRSEFEPPLADDLGATCLADGRVGPLQPGERAEARSSRTSTPRRPRSAPRQPRKPRSRTRLAVRPRDEGDDLVCRVGRSGPVGAARPRPAPASRARPSLIPPTVLSNAVCGLRIATPALASRQRNEVSGRSARRVLVGLEQDRVMAHDRSGPLGDRLVRRPGGDG